MTTTTITLLLAAALSIIAADTNGLFVIDKEGKHAATVELSTNVVTEWTTVREVDCKIPAQYAVYCTDSIYQVGLLITNKVVNVIANGKTNSVVIAEIGRDEWPSQKRVQQVPARHRMFEDLQGIFLK